MQVHIQIRVNAIKEWKTKQTKRNAKGEDEYTCNVVTIEPHHILETNPHLKVWGWNKPWILWWRRWERSTMSPYRFTCRHFMTKHNNRLFKVIKKIYDMWCWMCAGSFPIHRPIFPPKLWCIIWPSCPTWVVIWLSRCNLPPHAWQLLEFLTLHFNSREPSFALQYKLATYNRAMFTWGLLATSTTIPNV
jgi:hypothetical protein